MSKKDYIKRYIFVCILGVLLHFTYEWSGENRIVGFFSAVNESTWEHLKLIFFPMLILTICDLFNCKENKSKLIQNRTLGILAGILTIIFLFYAIWGVLGTRYDFINIGTYFVGVFVSFYTENKLSNKLFGISTITCIIILIYLTISFVAFTYNNSNIGIFFDFKGVGPRDYFR